MVQWVIFQAIEPAGAGLVIPILLPAVQAPLTDADTALAASTWTFVQSFGLVWVATIPATIFNKRSDQLAPSQMQDPAVLALLSGGRAYQHTTRLLLETLPAPVASQVSSVVLAGLKRIWQIAVVFAVLGFALVSLEKIKLR